LLVSSSSIWILPHFQTIHYLSGIHQQLWKE